VNAMPAMPIRLLLLLSLTVTAALRAQDSARAEAAGSPRTAVVGRALDAEGRAVARATVTLHGSVELVPGGFAGHDHVTATTDERGWFRAEILDAYTYSAWATTPATGPDASARHTASTVIEDVRGGDVVSLTLREMRCFSHLRVHDHDSFPPFVVRSVRVYLRAVHAPPIQLHLDRAGRAPLPPLPECDAAVVLEDADGQPVVALTLQVEYLRTLEGDAETYVFEPKTLPVVIRDPSGGSVPHAELRTKVGFLFRGQGRTEEVWRTVATTGASPDPGDPPILVARYGFDPFEDGSNQLFSVAGPDLSESFTGWRAAHFVSGSEPAVAPKRPPLVCVARPATRWTATVRRGGRPVAGATVVVAVDASLRPEPGTKLGLDRVLTAQTDRDGGFSIALPHRFAWAEASVFGGGIELAEAPVLHGFADIADAPAVLELDALRAVRLQVLLADGGPADGAAAVLLPASTELSPFSARELRMDRAGRVELRAQAGSWVLFAWRGGEAYFEILDIPPSAPDGGPAPVLALRVDLAPVPAMRGILRHPDGSPAAASPIYVVGHSGGRRTPASDRLRLMKHYGTFLNQRLARAVRSDAEGHFTLPFFSDDGGTFTATTPWGGQIELAETVGDPTVWVLDR